MVEQQSTREVEAIERRWVCLPLKGQKTTKSNGHDCRYQIIILSNQKKISIQTDLKAGRSESKSLTNFKEKLLAIMRQLDIPLSIYAATQYDEYRKPRMGMWKEFVDDYDLDVDDTRIDLEGSFFVGDAAGRPGDHSCVDRYDLHHYDAV